MTRFIDITPKKFHCVGGACPSIQQSEDGKTLRITGAHIFHTQDRAEAMIEISAEL